MPPNSRSRGFVWLARVLLVVLPTLCLFGVTELGLWMLNTPRLADDKAFIQHEFMRNCRSNPQLIHNRCSEDVFPEPESKASVFVFGGSSVQGHPVNETTPFSTYMQAILEREYPAEYAVHNLGVACRDSIYVRKCAELARGDASDLYVIYAGHNDFANFVLENPRLRIFSEEYPALFAAQASFAKSRLYSLLSMQFKGRPKSKYAAFYRIADPQWSESKRIALEEYQSNITEVIEQASQLGVEVLLVTVVSNLSEFPNRRAAWNKSLNPRNPIQDHMKPWHERYKQGIRLFRDAKYAESLQAFKQARDLSMVGRAPSELNHWLRQMSKIHAHVHLVDFERTLDRVGMKEGLGCNFFGTSTWCDQFHPNPRTQRMIAQDVVEKLVQLRAHNND